MGLREGMGEISLIWDLYVPLICLERRKIGIE
jgi:hypothetical protein